MMLVAILIRAALMPAALAALLWLLGVDLDFAPPEPAPPPQALHATDTPVWVGPKP